MREERRARARHAVTMRDAWRARCACAAQRVRLLKRRVIRAARVRFARARATNHPYHATCLEMSFVLSSLPDAFYSAKF